MGCDIHLFVEKRVNGEWQAVAPAGMELAETEDWGDGPESRLREDWFNDRHYELYSWLADVRSSGRSVPLAEPRGLPENVSKEVAEESKRWNGDGHSHTHFTVPELLFAFEDAAPVEYYGYVAATHYEAWKAAGDLFPPMWSGGVFGPMKMTEEEYLKKRELLPMPSRLITSPISDVHIFCTWSVPRVRAFEHFHQLLVRIQNEVDPDARIVFWFDN